MRRMDDLRQSGSPLDRFLLASVGEDRTGNPVTVLSTFARLGLDPWEEASDLSKLTPDQARQRLGTLLARFRDVAGSGSTTQRLIDLLPRKGPLPTDGEALSPARLSSLGLGPILTIMAVLSVLVVLVQTLFRNSTGSGD